MRTPITNQNADNHHAGVMTGAAKRVSVMIRGTNHRRYHHDRGSCERSVRRSTRALLAARVSSIALAVRLTGLTAVKSP